MIKFKHILIFIIILLLFNIELCLCSVGDRLPHFRKCLNNCLQNNCSNISAIKSFNERQPIYMHLIGWNCGEECRHECQWNTVTHLLNSGLNTNQLPQFYGKWSFIRMFGIQEPASVVFSLLNLLSNFYGWNKYRKSIESDPYFNIWTLQAMLAINAWIWSTVFHTRETSISEKFDYFFAYSVVIYSLFALTVRFFVYFKIGEITPTVYMGIGVPFMAFFLYHIHYLFYIHFDYGYNMKVNVITGALSSVGWLLWSFTNRYNGVYVWKCVFTFLALNLLLLLEINDFPPIGFIFDAHSLWHLGTVPIPLLWFSYLTDEANHSYQSKVNTNHVIKQSMGKMFGPTLP